MKAATCQARGSATDSDESAPVRPRLPNTGDMQWGNATEWCTRPMKSPAGESIHCTVWPDRAGARVSLARSVQLGEAPSVLGGGVHRKQRPGTRARLKLGSDLSSATSCGPRSYQPSLNLFLYLSLKNGHRSYFMESPWDDMRLKALVSPSAALLMFSCP